MGAGEKSPVRRGGYMLYCAKCEVIEMLVKTKVTTRLSSVVRGLDAGNGYREMVAVGRDGRSKPTLVIVALGLDLRRGGRVGTIT